MMLGGVIDDCVMLGVVDDCVMFSGITDDCGIRCCY